MSSGNDTTFARELQKKIKEVMPKSVRNGIVESIDEDNETISVKLDDETIVYNVRIKAAITSTGEGIIIFPTVNTPVLIGSINNNERANYMVSCTSISKMLIKRLNGVSMELSDILKLNGDQYDGIVKVNDLTTKLNNLESKVNSLITQYNLHVHTGVTSGTASTAITPQIIVGTLTLTTASEIKNNKVKHG